MSLFRKQAKSVSRSACTAMRKTLFTLYLCKDSCPNLPYKHRFESEFLLSTLWQQILNAFKRINFFIAFIVI